MASRHPKVALVMPDAPFLMEPRTFPMLGPLYLSSVLKEMGHSVEVIDLTGGRELPSVDADIVGITATTPQFAEAVRILGSLRAANPKQRIVIGGPHASVCPDECLAAGFDQVCIGEGETAIAKMVGDGIGDPLVCYPLIEDIDTIPFPDREAIDVRGYRYYLNGRKTTTMLTSRGCPYNCSFCCKAPWGNTVRFRSKESVLKEAALVRDLGFEGIMFYDDNMLLRKGRDWGIFAGLLKLGMVYRCFTRSTLLDEDSVKIMANTGCVEVLLGIESGSDRILRNINKGETREDHRRAMALLKRHGIRVKAACIVGLPGESWESVRETESLIEETQPDDVDFTVLSVYRGSPIQRNPERFDLRFGDSNLPYKTIPGQYRAGVSTSRMTAGEIVKARDYLEAKFKPHPKE